MVSDSDVSLFVRATSVVRDEEGNIERRKAARGAAICILALLLLVGVAMLGGGGESEPDAPQLPVENVDQEQRYDTIQNAVENASNGDEIHVDGGEYHLGEDGQRGIHIDKDITLVADGDARLVAGDNYYYSKCHADPAHTADCAITISGDSNVTIEGFDIQNFETGIYGMDASGEVVVRDTTFENSRIYANESSADWRVENTSITNRQSTAIFAVGSSGDWVVDGSTINGSDFQSAAIQAGGSFGDWQVRQTVIQGHGYGVSGYYNPPGRGDDNRWSKGDWSIEDSTITDNSLSGVKTSKHGRWSVVQTQISNNGGGITSYTHLSVENSTITENAGAGVLMTVHFVGGASHFSWSIEDSTVSDNAEYGIRALTEGNWCVSETVLGDNGQAGLSVVTDNHRETIQDGAGGTWNTGEC